MRKLSLSLLTFISIAFALALVSPRGTAELYNWGTQVTSLTLTNLATGTNAVLVPDGANTLALRNSTTAQTLRLYSTYTDASNYERLTFDYNSGGGRFRIFNENAGTGAGTRSLLVASGTGGLELSGNQASAIHWKINSLGHFLAVTDNTYDIGASGATRPRIVFAAPSGGFSSTGTNTVPASATGATNTLTYNVVLYVTAATSAALTDNAGTTEFSGVTISNFTPIRLQPGGKFTGTSITYATGTASHAW